MRKVSDIAKGVAVVSVVGAGYLSSIFNLWVNDIVQDPTLDTATREVRHVNIEEDNFVYCNTGSKRSKLSLASIQDLVDSLGNCGIANANILHEVKMYDKDNNESYSVFESKDSRVEATVLGSGQVVCCKLKALRDIELTALKSIISGSEYSLKNVSDGVMLERNGNLYV